MSRPLQEILATLPSGETGIPLGREELGAYLKTWCGSESEKERRKRHALRDEMYHDGGCDHMRGVVNDVFKDSDVRLMRSKWIPYARFSNPLKRIVGDISTVYAEPAKRTVGGSDANQRKFDDLAEAVMLDEVMHHANQMLNLHRAVLVGPRVRIDEDGIAELAIDVLTPANVFAVTHPNDTTRVVAWGIRVEYRSHRTEWPRTPAWQLWSSHEVMLLDAEFVPITSKPHGLGVNPWVALTYNATAIPGFWPGEEGEDLIAAQVSIWFAGILLLKETKSATNVPIVSGDVTAAARAQAADTEVPVEVPEGTSVSTVDMSMDTSIFTDASDHVLERTGNGYGLSMAALQHQGIQSAEAREVMLEPLRQLRRKQIKTFRRAERALVALIAAVLKVDAPLLVFDVVAFSVDFGEPQVLVSEMERLTIFEKKRAMGLDNTVDMYRRQNPDCRSDAEALIAIMRNIEIETSRIEMMRAQMSMSGALGGTAARADGADTGGRPPSNPPADEPAPSDDLSWVEGVINAAA